MIADAQGRAAAVAENGNLMRRATYASMSVASILVIVKFAAWLLTDSVAMLSTLVDSVLDALASLVTMLAIRHALTPADREHRFGHGKAEPLAGVGQSAFIAGSAMLVLFEAGKRLWQPRPIASGEIGIAVMVFSIIVTMALVTYQRHVVRTTGSIAVSGDSLHYTGDLLANTAVIASLIAAQWFGLLWIDPLFGAAIAGFLIFSAWQIASRAFSMLMDRELPDADRERIKAIAMGHPEVSAIHELRTRSSGPQRFIQFHLEMDGGLTLMRAHAIADAVEAEVLAAFPDAEIIIHQDPAGQEQPVPSFAQSR